jgi:hypothetical protein
MELIEIIGWIVLGFVPMFAGLEIVSSKLKDRGKIALRIDIRGGEQLIGL